MNFINQNEKSRQTRKSMPYITIETNTDIRKLSKCPMICRKSMKYLKIVFAKNAFIIINIESRNWFTLTYIQALNAFGFGKSTKICVLCVSIISFSPDLLCFNRLKAWNANNVWIGLLVRLRACRLSRLESRLQVEVNDTWVGGRSAKRWESFQLLIASDRPLRPLRSLSVSIGNKTILSSVRCKRWQRLTQCIQHLNY